MNADPAVWKSIVYDGALQDKGMVSFAPVISEEEAEALRAYVVRRAHETTN